MRPRRVVGLFFELHFQTLVSNVKTLCFRHFLRKRDGLTHQRTDGPMDGHTLLCEKASKNEFQGAGN